MKEVKKLISVIIPAYRQEKTIVKDLKRIEKVLSRIRYVYEMVVIVDGRVDKTYERAKKFAVNKSKIRIYQYRENQGKGYAIRVGMDKSKGNYVAFIDSGLEIDPNGLSMLLEHLEWYNADIIVGSKRHLASQVNYPLDRRILSSGYYWLVRFFFGFKVKDTQAGIKIFKIEVLKKVLPVLLVKEYAFDIEILSVAYRFGYKRIYEAPIKLDYRFGSITNAATLKVIWKMLWDTAAVFYRLKILKYYDREAKKLKIK